ncbi:SagB family peptide dehydrogenase [Saccharibacillus alkalitolerans]|uniref:SagB/ThcOx family dehydrogenase n=1 Tax=Saccharibacillus alkalitolerans TaxID=2705290 RepID=A0ABX0F307_9BACL|nr:SagB family peptide dehydrogenase [Saccharibacillus alkalitolerans]NGZ75301.1 SagB/ThcOx family dehydrogenase [Saccharibacillus alkalitolerans]
MRGIEEKAEQGGTLWWETEPDRSALRRYFHERSVSRKNYTSVQIKKVKAVKRWDRKEGLALRRFEPQTELEELLLRRRTRRFRSAAEPDAELLARLLQFAVGVTDERSGYFAYPSPGALYPCTLFLSVDLPELRGNVYRYNPYLHVLELYAPGRADPLEAAIIDRELAAFPIKLFFASDYQLLEEKYGELSYRLLNQEIGHMAQNLSLCAEDLALNTVCIGGFYEEEFKRAVPDYDLLYVMVVG